MRRTLDAARRRLAQAEPNGFGARTTEDQRALLRAVAANPPDTWVPHRSTASLPTWSSDADQRRRSVLPVPDPDPDAGGEPGRSGR